MSFLHLGEKCRLRNMGLQTSQSQCAVYAKGCGTTYIVFKAVADCNDPRLVGMAAQGMGMAVDVHIGLADAGDLTAHLFI